MSIRSSHTVSAILTAFTLAAFPAVNAAVTLVLDTPGSTLTGQTGPFGTIEVELVNPGTATITITAASGWRLGGDAVQDALGSNIWMAPIVGTSTSFSELTGDGTTWTIGSGYSHTVIGSESGQYSFYNVFGTLGGYSNTVGEIVFTAFNAYNAWTSEADVLIPGKEYSAYFYSTADNGATRGYGSAIAVPEPASAGLLALGACSLFARRRRHA